jgi:hypothetical protein
MAKPVPAARFDRNAPARRRHMLLRATYLALVVGLAAFYTPALIAGTAMARGVIPALLGGVWLVALVGLRYPLQMLPLLVVEVSWKTIWLLVFGFAHGAPGPIPPTFTDDPRSIAFSVVPIPIVAPFRGPVVIL